MIICISIFIAIIAVLYLLNLYCNGTQCKATRNLTGQVVFITGANTGIGKETAIELAKLGATIIIACRDQNKGQQVVNQILKLGVNKDNIKMISLDLTDLAKVRQCVKEFQGLRLDKIDILINNAGVMAPQQYEITKQGFELQMGTNHLGHFLLTELLVPYLKNATEPRVINVSSIAHNFSNLDLKDFQSQKYIGSRLWKGVYNYKTYGNSKLCNVLHAQELFYRHQIKGCSLHPGVVRTELVRHQMSHPIMKSIYQLATPIFSIFSKSPLQGAQTTLHCALINYKDLVNGGYYKECKLSIPKQLPAGTSNKVWEISQELTK